MLNMRYNSTNGIRFTQRLIGTNDVAYDLIQKVANVDKTASLTFYNGNIGIGTFAASAQITGSNTLAIGESSLRYCTGSNNVGIGVQSLDSLISGFNNVSVGIYSGGDLVTGNGNTFIGNSAALAVASGNNNTFIGNISTFSKCHFITDAPLNTYPLKPITFMSLNHIYQLLCKIYLSLLLDLFQFHILF
jgi:hypothetical protein